MLVALVMHDSTALTKKKTKKNVYPVVSAHFLSLQHHTDNAILSSRAMKWVATYPINQLKQMKTCATDTAGYLQESHNALRVSCLSGIDCAIAAVLHHLSSSGCKQLGTFNKVGPLCESAYIYGMAVGKPVKKLLGFKHQPQFF